LLLESQGRLSLDDDIREYIPEMHDFSKTITLRHLAGHTSGLRDFISLTRLAGWQEGDVLDNEHMLNIIFHQKELNFEPGEQFIYSNTGFILLAEVVSRISDQSFASFADENIFKPLNMTNTQFVDSPIKIVKNKAYSYIRTDGGYEKSLLNSGTVGPGGLYTTVDDLAIWTMNFSKQIIGNDSIFRQMNSLAKLNNGHTFGRAYGQRVSSYKGLLRIDHSGSAAGYRSYLGRFPEQNYAIIVLSNSAAARIFDLPEQVTDFILKEYIESEEEEEIYAKKQEDITKYIGQYWNSQDLTFRKISSRNGRLLFFSNPTMASGMQPIGMNTYQFKNPGGTFKIRFIDVEEPRRAFALERNSDPYSDDNEQVVFQYYDPIKPTRDELEDFTGIYHSEELQTSYTLVLEENGLIFRNLRCNDILLMPQVQDVFTTDQWFIETVKFERDDNNKVKGICISNQRAKNIYFKKTAHNIE